jgi:hypothetical protein
MAARRRARLEAATGFELQAASLFTKAWSSKEFLHTVWCLRIWCRIDLTRQWSRLLLLYQTAFHFYSSLLSTNASRRLLCVFFNIATNVSMLTLDLLNT